MKAHIVRRILVGPTGESVLFPIGAFTDEKLAKDFAEKDGLRLRALQGALTVLPGLEEPFFKTVGNLGIRNIGQDVMELEIKESGLVVPSTPRIVLAK